MSDYLHGAYGQITESGSKVSSKSKSAFVYVGTAPVHNVEGGSKNVNVPVLVSGIGEAMAKFGYSDDWDKYTLCEAMHVHMEEYGVGPLVLINVLDPSVHKVAEQGTKSLTPSKGRVVITDAQDIIIDTLEVTGKTKGTDYTVSYDRNKKTLTLIETSSGSLGTSALAIKYNSVDASAVDADDVIGASDGEGTNTGLYAIKNVYQMTGYIPSFLLAPGFSGTTTVNTAMCDVAKKINGHWDAWVLSDLPLVNGESQAITLSGAATYKTAQGYNQENEKVYFPMGDGVDGKKYHLSVLAAGSLNKLLLQNDGVPYMTDSNTECPLIGNIWMGASNTGKLYDDQMINENLNKNGIASAAYVGGRFALWGAHCADYTPSNAGEVNIADTNRMMMYYLSNDFQHRRARDVDKPLTANDLKSMVSEEQARLDALVKIGALVKGEVFINAEKIPKSDVFTGDYVLTFRISTTPLAKSLTADVVWTNDGYATYFDL